MYLKPKTKQKATFKSDFKLNWKIVAGVVGAIAICTVLFVAVMNLVQKDQAKDQVAEAPTSSQTQTKNQSSSTTQTTPTNNTDPTNKTPAQYEGNNPNNSNQITGSITSAFVANNKFELRVHIDQFLSKGNCTLTMTQGERKFVQTTPIVNSASTSTCQGFSASADEVGPGTWSVDIQINTNEKKGNIKSEVNL